MFQSRLPTFAYLYCNTAYYYKLNYYYIEIQTLLLFQNLKVRIDE